MLRFLVWAISAALRPRALLVAENVCLRQQLGVLQRRHRQPRLRNGDRQFWICASRWFTDWRNSLLIVSPETVLRWHRRGWRAYWSWRSNRGRRRGRRPISQELTLPVNVDQLNEWLFAELETEEQTDGTVSDLSVPRNKLVVRVMLVPK